MVLHFQQGIESGPLFPVVTTEKPEASKSVNESSPQPGPSQEPSDRSVAVSH